MVFGSSYIEIGKYQFTDRVNSVSIEQSWKELAQTATIRLPNIKRLLEKEIVVGDPVLIQLGYNDNLVEEFRGFVSGINPGSPVEFECMDEMWNLKQQSNITKAWKSTTVKEVLKYLVPGATLDVPDITLSPFRIDKINTFEALKKLKESYNLVIYFRDGKLFCGLAYQEDAGEVKYRLSGKTANCLIGELKFKKSTDVKIKVNAISLLPNNTSISVDAGDTDGELRTLHFYNLTKDELKKQAEEKINLLKFDGYRGSLIGFGLPFAKFGMTAHLFDDNYPEREGIYFIDSVKTTYSVQAGYRRVVTLGRKANGTLIQAA